MASGLTGILEYIRGGVSMVAELRLCFLMVNSCNRGVFCTTSLGV